MFNVFATFSISRSSRASWAQGLSANRQQVFIFESNVPMHDSKVDALTDCLLMIPVGDLDRI